MNWALLIREMRRVCGLKQDAAAALFGVSQATLSRWEAGVVTPSLSMRHRILKTMREIAPAEQLDQSFGLIAACRFIIAASRGNVAAIKEMLSEGVDPNCADYDDRTALHLAASEGHAEAVSVLLENGADANAKDRCERTPLDWARKCGHDAIAQLIGQGARAGDDGAMTCDSSSGSH